MKIKIFTLSHPVEDLVDCNTRFSSIEHTQVVQKANKGSDLSKEIILREFLSQESMKLIALNFLIQQIQLNKCSMILSLGSDNCVIEYLLSLAMPKDAKIVATDFNDFFIGNSKKYFPEIISERFDFFNDTIEELSKRVNVKFDFAYFLGSAYVMDDEEYISILSQIRKGGIKQIIDFSPAFIPYSHAPIAWMGELKWELNHNFRGKFHGFRRTSNEYRKIYKQAGWIIEHEKSFGHYQYVANLKNPEIV
jgi:hypothetical protein